MSAIDPEFYGGAYGRAASVLVATAELTRLATACREADEEVAASAAVLAATVRDVQAELVRCARYAPFGAAELEARLLGSVLEARLRSSGLGELARIVAIAAARYDDVEAEVRRGLDRLGDTADVAGVGVGLGVATVVVGAAVVVGAGYLVVAGAPGGGRVLVAGPGGRRPVDVTNTVLPSLWAKGAAGVLDLPAHVDPALVERAVDGTGLVLAPLLSAVAPDKGADGVNASTAVAAAALARLYHGGPAVVGPARSLPPRSAPADVRQLVAGLDGDPAERRNASGGRVDVLTRTWNDATRRRRTAYTVLLPGTTRWNRPGDPRARDVRDAQANLELRGGIATAEMRVMTAALRRAGVPPGADVTLVGHSQGGATAAALSTYRPFADAYRVRGVVTVGAPVGGIRVPDHVPALHLQDRRDPVPALDGEPPADRPGHLTMSFDGPGPGGMPRHAVSNYAEGGRLFDDAAARGAEPGADDGRRSAEQARARLVEVGALAPDGHERVQVTRVVLERDT